MNSFTLTMVARARKNKLKNMGHAAQLSNTQAGTDKKFTGHLQHKENLKKEFTVQQQYPLQKRPDGCHQFGLL
jgi:hypothetical protein